MVGSAKPGTDFSRLSLMMFVSRVGRPVEGLRGEWGVGERLVCGLCLGRARRD